MANSFPASGLAYADQFAVGRSSGTGLLNTFLSNDLNTIQIRAESDTSGVVSYLGMAPAFLEYYRNVATGVDLTIQTKIQAAGGGGAIVFSPNSPSADLTPVERMRITKGGSVGIGTASPGTNLEVFGTDAEMMVHYTGNSRGGFRAMATQRLAILTTSSSDNLVFGYETDFKGTFTERMRINNSTGNVGIGTTSPVGKLDIATGGNTNIVISNDATDTGYNIVSLNGTRTKGSYAGIAGGGTGDNKLYLNSGDAVVIQTGASYTARMSITCAGNVGINTASPSAKLAVEGSATDVENVARFNNQVNCTTRVWLRNSNHSAYWGLSSTITADPLATGMCAGAMTLGFGNDFPIQLWNGATPSVKMTITSAGNIGIGTGGPSYKLHVNGTFYAAGSSQDYKQGICKYDTDSCMFMKLKPVTYQYKDEFKHLGKELKSQTQIGLIAEEVAEVAPELAILVKENDNDVVRNVDYEKLTIVLLSEVQKLRKELDDLKTK